MNQIEFFEKLEVEIQKDDLSEFESLLTDYYQKFEDSVEIAEELKEKYPQFPLITEYLYEGAVETEKYLDEYIESERINLEKKEKKLLKEENLLACVNNEDFFEQFFDYVDEYSLPGEIIEKLNVDKFIDKINKLTNIRESEVKEKIYLLLHTIGKIKCKESVKYLNNLLDDYMLEIDSENRRYKNYDFFEILDCMVKQQDKSSISHILKARDYFPEENLEYIVCQIAAGRIKKQKPEGYLPMEALEIALPSGQIFNALSGGEMEYEDNFDELYGEYFE